MQLLLLTGHQNRGIDTNSKPVLTGQVGLSFTNLRELLSAWQFAWQGTFYTNPLKSRTVAVNRIKKKNPGVDGCDDQD